MYGYWSVVKSKQGLCSQEASPSLYLLPVNPPTIQHFVPVAAAVITGLDGEPQAQSENVPPVTQPPLVTSNPSVYGNTEMGAPHCAVAFCTMQKIHT